MSKNPKLDDIYTQIKREERERQDNAQLDLAKYRRQLRLIGYTALLFTYNGSGDSGAIEGRSVQPENLPGASPGESTGDPSSPIGLLDAVEELMYNFLPPGWENNEGGQGEIIFDLGTGEVAVNHEYNVTQVEREEFRFQIPNDDPVVAAQTGEIDLKACPHCGSPAVQFQEVSIGVNENRDAWVCDACGHVTFPEEVK